MQVAGKDREERPAWCHAMAIKAWGVWAHRLPAQVVMILGHVPLSVSQGVDGASTCHN